MGALARVALVALACVARARGVAGDLAVRDFAAVGDAWRFQGAASNASTSDAVATEVLRITLARANAEEYEHYELVSTHPPLRLRFCPADSRIVDPTSDLESDIAVLAPSASLRVNACERS